MKYLVNFGARKTMTIQKQKKKTKFLSGSFGVVSFCFCFCPTKNIAHGNNVTWKKNLYSLKLGKSCWQKWPYLLLPVILTSEKQKNWLLQLPWKEKHNKKNDEEWAGTGKQTSKHHWRSWGYFGCVSPPSRKVTCQKFGPKRYAKNRRFTASH